MDGEGAQVFVNMDLLVKFVYARALESDLDF